jgi:TonB dependent receptor/Carboxypeptidase regulatory-like domain
MTKLPAFFAAATLALGAGSLIHTGVAYAQASSVGQLRGVVKDKGTNEAAVGATVVATSPALQGEQVVITDETGQYFVTSLPAGMYTLTVYYNDTTYARSNVLVQVGKEAVINITVNTAENSGKPKGEVITIAGTAPIVDQGSTKTGLTLTSDYTNNVPTGRTFGATMGAAAGSQGDQYGISFAGSTSVENTYVIEGINTTDTAYGQLSSNLPNEFISETEVITGGYNAEYGRATGGIVNVVTKQGSNEFHGSIFGNLNSATFTAPAKVIQAEGGSIDNQVNPGNIWDAGFELGGPIIKDKLWFHVGFDPSVSNVNDVRIVQTQVDKNNDGVPDVDPATGLTKHEEVSRANIDGSTKTYYFTGKLNGAIDQNNQFQISVFGNPDTAHSPITPTTNQGRVPGLTDDSIDTTGGAEDVSAKWTSKLNNGKTQFDAVVGYHHATTGATAANALGNQSLVFYNYTRSLNDFADIEGSQISGKCSDGPGDPYPMIQNCPVRVYQDSGLGLLQQNTNNRATAALSVTQRVKAAGYHVFKAGVDYEGSTYDQLGEFSGGIGSFRRSPDTATGGPGTWRINSFYTIERNLTPDEVANPDAVTLGQNETICSNGHALCKSSGTLNADTSDTSIGAYLQDSWQIVPNFTINAGVRYENQNAGTAKQLQGTVAPTGETVGTTGFDVNNWAPRIGFVWDPTQEGKSKIFAHWGRFYENVPMDLNIRSFGGEIDNIGNYGGKHVLPGATGYDPNCNVDHGTVQGDIGKTVSQCSDFAQVAILGGGTEFVTPGLSGQYSDELIIGTEYEVLPDVKVGLNYVHRTLPVVMEDILTGTGDYYITNPSENFDQQAADLSKQAAVEQMSTDPATKAKGDLDAGRAAGMARIKLFDQPARNYDAVQLQITQRPTKNSLILASYTYSKEQGNFPGLFSTETGQLDPNITSEFDLPALMANRYGAMGLDRPHNVKVDGFYRFDLKQAGLVTIGASLRAQSGIPHNVLGADPSYGPGESYLLPRGVADRSPTTGQADVHLAYGRRIGKGNTLEIFGDVFNLTDAQQEATQDEIYTDDAAHPIVGGDMNDLKHVKTIDATSSLETAHTPALNPDFGHTTAYLQSPRSFRFGMRLTF